MKSIKLFTFILAFLFSAGLNAQTAIEPKLEKWTTYNSKATLHGGSIHLTRVSDNSGNNSALLWLNDTNFKNGVVELDIKGKDVRGQSFVGIAFHGVDNDYYDAIYFRPFNFKNPERKDHSVQYIDKPNNDWSVLREKHPGKYENTIHPVPDPNDWFHAKIVINFPEIKVYVNGSTEPTLEVNQISKRESGKLGLWLDSDDGWFKNVSVTHLN